MRFSCFASPSPVPFRFLSPALIAGALALSPLLPVRSVHADTSVWTGSTGSGNWSSAGNWSGGVPVSSDTTQLVFGAVDSSKKTSTNDLVDFTLALLQFDDTGYTLGGNALTFVGTAPQIVQYVASTNTIANEVRFTAPSLTTDILGTLTLSGRLSSLTGSLVKTGTGTLALTNTANSIGGSLLINAGTVSLTTGGVLNSSTGYIGGDQARFYIDSNGGRWNNSGDLYIGNNGAGNLTLSADAVVNNRNAYISNNSLVWLFSSASQWNNSGNLYIGYGSAGTLQLVHQGVTNVTGATNLGSAGLMDTQGGVLNTGTLTGSGLIKVAYEAMQLNQSGDSTFAGTIQTGALPTNFTKGGAGTLTLTNSGNNLSSIFSVTGGALVLAEGGRIRSNGGGVRNGGTVTISGAGSQWNTSGSFSVGSSTSAGTLNIVSGGLLSNLGTSIDGTGAAPSTANISGPGSQWINSGNVIVSLGTTNSSFLNITNGGIVSNARATVGYAVLGTGAVTVSGSGSQWNNSAELYLGSEGNGTLSISNGGKVSNTICFIANGSSSISAVDISGANSQWINSNNLYTGVSGRGTLTITNGGTVSNTSAYLGLNTGSTGTVTVDGVGSQWNNSSGVNVGGNGSGSLIIRNGGTVNAGSLQVGLSSGTTNIITVDGAGSQLLNGAISVAAQASSTATLNVTQGATVTTTGGSGIGIDPGSTGIVNVNGAGSRWDNGASLTVGLHGTGTVNITNGGVVTNAYGFIGELDASSTGTVTVDGVGSQWNNNGYLFIGDGGKGTLNITSGGLVTSTGPANIKNNSMLTANGGTLTTSRLTGTGTVQVSGSGLTLNQGGDGTFDGTIQNGTSAGSFTKSGSGNLTLTRTATHTGGTILNAGTLTLATTGVLVGNTSVTGGMLTNNGTINGLTTISGGIAQGTGNYAGGYTVQAGGSVQFGIVQFGSLGMVRSGSATWNGGGKLLFPINFASGTAGTNWGLNEITGNLSLVAGSSPFVVSFQSGSPSGSTSFLAGFDPASSYSWDFAHVTGGITGFDASLFAVDTSSFAAFNTGSTTGTFRVSQSGNTLRVNYTGAAVVPETGTGLLVLLGSLAGVAGMATRRRK